MSFGFCFALLPLLSLEPETVFGRGHKLIKLIPFSDLTTPEEYLDKIQPTGKYNDAEESDREGVEEQEDHLKFVSTVSQFIFWG